MGDYHYDSGSLTMIPNQMPAGPSNMMHISNPSSAASSVPNTDEEDEDMERKQSTKERRREAHTMAEKKRREAIRKGYSDLQVVLPGDNSGNSSSMQKMSKTIVLQKTLEYIESLQENNKKQSEEVQRLRKEKQAFAIMKENYEQIVIQHQLASGGACGTLSYEVKFDVFKEIMEQLFMTFEASLLTSDFAELSGSIINWIEEKCKPENFKTHVNQVLHNYGSK